MRAAAQPVRYLDPCGYRVQEQDFAFLNSLRTNISSLRYYAISVAMSLVVTGIGWAVWMQVGKAAIK